MSAQTITTVYKVRDDSGQLVAEHVREDQPDGTKQVRWRQPNGTWGLNGTRLEELPLFGAERLVDWPEEYPVIVVEGEKAADALNRTGRLFAVATVTGAGPTPGAEALELLRDREVILWPDGDTPGRAHMERVAERLHRIAASVSIFTWHDAPDNVKGPDAADHPAVMDGSEKALGMLLNDLLGASRWEPAGGHPPPGTNGYGRPQPPAGYNLTDLGNAERFTARYGENVRYCYPWGKWLTWTGARWERDEAGRVNRLAKETVRSIYAEAAAAVDDGQRRALAKHATASEAKNRIEAMLDLAKSDVPVSPDDLDADPNLLNVANGTLDLRTGELRPHRREDLLTKIAGAGYDPDAPAPAWETFLERVLPGEELRRFVRRAAGYSATGDTGEQVMFINHGGGNNGKSTFQEALSEALGDYAMRAPTEMLMVKRGGGVPNDVARLKGSRFVTASETEEGRRLAESLVKDLTGQDTITARFMRAEFFDFKPTHKLWLSTNHKPEIKGTDNAIWRRIRLIPWSVVVPPAERNRKLPEKLRAELAGVLAWTVRGCIEWRRDGLGDAEEVRAATAAYRADQDVLAAFIEECCVEMPGAWCAFKELYAAYQGWCEESGESGENKRRFGNRLTERGFAPDNGAKNVAIRHGIALRSDREPLDGGDGPRDARVNQHGPKTGPTSSGEIPGGAPVVNPPPLGLTNAVTQNTCKTGENGGRVNEGYPKNHIISSKAPHEGLYGNNINYINPGGLINPADDADQVAAFLEDPPAWWRVQAAECVQQGAPERLIRPLCTAAATAVYGSAHRWQEACPAVEDRLRALVDEEASA